MHLSPPSKGKAMVKSAWRRSKPAFFWIYSSLEGRFLLKTYWSRRLCWPPAGKLRTSGIQNFETRIFVIFDTNCVILNNFCRNSSFTGSGGWIIDSSRSGSCFSSCLASSKYFSIRKTCLFDVFLFFCVSTHRFHSLKSVSGPCSIEIMYPCEWRIAIPASLMRVDYFCFFCFVWFLKEL